MVCGTLSVHVASMLTTRFSRDCNVVCALWAEECEIPEEFVLALRASISSTDTCPSKAWNHVYDDLSSGFPVDCSGNGYVEGDDDEEESWADSQPEEKTPRKKAKSDNSKAVKSPSNTQCG